MDPNIPSGDLCEKFNGETWGYRILSFQIKKEKSQIYKTVYDHRICFWSHFIQHIYLLDVFYGKGIQKLQRLWQYEYIIVLPYP